VSASRCETTPACALLLAVLIAMGCDGTRGPVLSTPSAGRPKLLYVPTEEPTGLAGLTYVRDHLDEIEQLPFDGIAVDVGLGDTPWGTVAYTRAQFDAEVAMLQSIPFTKLTDNFEMFNTRAGDLDWFDDAAFAVVLNNARVAAEVVRDGKLRGIFLDVQDYDGPVWAFPRSGETTTFASYEAKAHERGVEFMAALLDVDRDISIIATVSYSEVFRAACLEGVALEDDSYRLLPAFLDGMAEARAAAGAPALIIDGFYSSYAARDPRSFPLFRDLIQGSLAGVQARWFPGIETYRLGVPTIRWDAEPMIRCSDDVRNKLTRDMPSAFGVMMDYDTMTGDDFHRDPAEFGLNFFTPDELTTTLSAALGNAERYVYLWSASMDWLGVSTQPRPPAEYVQAVAAARVATR
jgi:hypothetical protein